MKTPPKSTVQALLLLQPEQQELLYPPGWRSSPTASLPHTAQAYSGLSDRDKSPPEELRSTGTRFSQVKRALWKRDTPALIPCYFLPRQLFWF